ncbi:MAG: NRAMP family divalent metal transporter, partial [Acidimicrobiales bacterium]
LLWVLLLLIPVLIVNQEMVVRLGTVTGVGHARLINERFGRFWGAFSVGDLFVLNFLTIVTEFIGVALAADYFGVNHYIAVPLAAITLVVITASGSFRRFERSMFAFIAISLVLYPLALLSHPRWGHIAHDFVVPGIQGGINSGAVLLIIAIVGTTVAPWQLFFQQSNVIDKRITPRFINYERTDTVLGSVVVVLGAAAIMIAAAYAFRAGPLHGQFSDALGVARGLRHMGHALGALFAVALLDASIVGAVAVTLATSYAFGDVFNMRHSLHRSWRDAKKFYGSYTAMVILAAAIVLIPGAPLGLITTSVQALAGLLLPSASVFLLLLCNDTAVLGPWVNKTWLNGLASLIIAVLLVLSGVLMATTLFTKLNVTHLFIELAGAMAVLGLGGLAYVRLVSAKTKARTTPSPELSLEEKMAWRMPQLTLLEPVKWSPGLRLGMSSLRAYLVLSAVLLVLKAVHLGH